MTRHNGQSSRPKKLRRRLAQAKRDQGRTETYYDARQRRRNFRRGR
jgi:hypothetical protein